MEISIIITNYNYEKYLARAIRSAINQSFDKNEYEIIVIDDTSEDNSQKIMRAYSGYIRSVYNEKNIGLASSCNKGIKGALGKYIIRLDADDFINRECLNLHHLFLSNNKEDIDATSSDYYDVDAKENIIRRRSGVTFPIACGTMYKLDDLIDIGLYDESLPREDWDLRDRFLKSKRCIYNIPIPLYKYTQHSNSLTRGTQ